MLLAICMALFVQPTAMAQVSGGYFEPTTDESARWNLYFLSQQIGPTHIYGNFSHGFTFDEPRSESLYVEFRINNYNTSYPNADKWWILVHNASSEPFEWNFSTLDFEAGIHEIDVTAWNLYDYDSGGVGLGGGTFFFEHEDRSGEQVLYTGASITVVVASLAGLVGAGFGCYKLFKWYMSRPRTSRFGRYAVIPAPD